MAIPKPVDEQGRLAIVSHNLATRIGDRWLVKNRIADVVNGLAEHGWQITVISRRSAPLPFLTSAVQPGVRVLTFGRGSLLARAREAWSILRTIRKSDRILAFMPSLFAGVLAVVAGRRAVVYAGASWALRDASRWRVWLESLVARRASEMIVAGDALLARFAPIGARTSLCVPLVPDEVCARLRSPASDPAEGHVPLRVLYVGSVREDKGVDDLLDALGSPSDVECRLVGPVPETPFGELLQARLAALSNVEADGYLEWDDLRQRYEWADVLVLASHSEGFPRVVYEATAFGVALVVSPVGGLAARLQDGRDALFVPPRDPPALRRALEALVADSRRVTSLAWGAHAALSPVFRHPNPIVQFDSALSPDRTEPDGPRVRPEGA